MGVLLRRFGEFTAGADTAHFESESVVTLARNPHRKPKKEEMQAYLRHPANSCGSKLVVALLRLPNVPSESQIAYQTATPLALHTIILAEGANA